MQNCYTISNKKDDICWPQKLMLSPRQSEITVGNVAVTISWCQTQSGILDAQLALLFSQYYFEWDKLLFGRFKSVEIPKNNE